jgi:hypothetical protein
VEGLLAANPNEFYIFSCSLFSLCVVSTLGKSQSALELKKGFFLVFLLSVEALLEADTNKF